MADDDKQAAKEEKAFHDNKLPPSRLPGESGDPDVHYLIAVRDALRRNREALAPPRDEAQIKGLDDKIADVDKQLADLGYKT